MRDIDGDYKRALLDEHAAYLRAGRSEDAEGVAKVLREQYGHEVAPKKAEPKQEKVAPEHTAAEKPPEVAVEPKPRRGGRPKLPRDAEGNIVRDGG